MSPEAKAFEAGWFAMYENLKHYIINLVDDRDPDWFNYHYDAMSQAYQEYQENNETKTT